MLVFCQIQGKYWMPKIRLQLFFPAPTTSIKKKANFGRYLLVLSPTNQAIKIPTSSAFVTRMQQYSSLIKLLPNFFAVHIGRKFEEQKYFVDLFSVAVFHEKGLAKTNHGFYFYPRAKLAANGILGFGRKALLSKKHFLFALSIKISITFATQIKKTPSVSLSCESYQG